MKGKESFRLLISFHIDKLIRLIVNTIVHEIVVMHTNRPESEHFLESEV